MLNRAPTDNSKSRAEPGRRGGGVTPVSVVAPVYNEQDVLPELLARLGVVAENLADRYDFEFVFVDDGSSDGSLGVARELAEGDPRLRVVELRRNYGQTAALQAGLDHARGAVVVSMDADLQHFPEDIPLLLEQIEAGYEVVCGWRHDRREGVIRRYPSAIANWIIRKVMGLSIHDIGTTFRAYTSDVARGLRLLGENHRFVPVFAKIAGARITEVKIQNVERPSGASNYGLSRTLNVLLDIFFVGFFVHYLDRPIRLFGRIALATFGFAVAISLGLTWRFVVDGVPVVREHSGWFILALILYLGSVQMLLFGILSEVLVRMYFQPQPPPPYNVRHVWGADAAVGGPEQAASARSSADLGR